jgi:hypothetical protein
MGPQDELPAVGRLLGHALGSVVGVVHGMHEALLDRVESALPPPASSVTALQRRANRLVYGGVAAAHRAIPPLGAGLAALAWPADGAAPSRTPLGRSVLPAVNGLWGDAVAAREPALALPMAVRSAGLDVVMDRAGVGAAFPEATPRLAVFLHGWCESDQSWWRASGGPGPTRSYGERLQAELGITPVYVRYNSGLRVSDNGRLLAGLIESLVAAWPGPVDDIALVGHSMGGLVARSACHQGTDAAMTWVPTARTLVTLGTPHHGAPLEKAVHLATWLASQAPEGRPLASLVNARSQGVKDLRFGAIVRADWDGHDPDELLGDHRTDVPFPGHVRHHWVAACLAGDHGHPIARAIGDGLVRVPSASGRGRARRLPFAPGSGAHVNGTGHLALLNHPHVYSRLRDWLAAA